MNYIYDVLINFKYPLFDFYEWNKKDNIKNIKRIPIFKVSSKVLNDFKNNKFKLNSLLDLISYQTQIYGRKKGFKYSVVLTDENEAIGFLFDNNGVCIGKSKMLLDEEQEVINISNNLKEVCIDYTLISNDNINHYITIKQINIKNYVISQLSNITNKDLLDYIYFECFNEYVNEPKVELLKLINKDFNDICYKIYNFLMMSPINKS